MEHLDFGEATVLVTGGSSGIGRDIALGFARARAQVLAADIDTEGLRALQQEARQDHLALTTRGTDVRRWEEVQDLFATAARAGPLGVFVHCAGITRVKTLTETSIAEYRDLVETNISGTFYCLQAAAVQMKDQGKGGAIIVISSINAQWPLATQAVYTATKAALELLAKTLAVEIAPYNVRVNVIAPGAIDTPMNKEVLGGAKSEALGRRIPMGRIGRPEDLVGIVLFLASSGAGYITGATVVVDGGFMISR